MNLQPSTSSLQNERRILFAYELAFGGHGQVPLTGSGTFTPTNSSCVFYTVEFLTSAVMASAGFRNYSLDGTRVYSANSTDFANFNFPAGYTWTAPLTSITLDSGTGIAYEYKNLEGNTITNDLW